MKPLIIIIGSNHSGTSLVAELLLSNGAITGTCKEDSRFSYKKREDMYFKMWCQDKIGFPHIHDTDDSHQAYIDNWQLRDYLNSFNDSIENMNTTVFMKYPKAMWVLHKLPVDEIHRPIKVVACLRNPILQIKSILEKDKTIIPTNAFNAYCASWDVISRIRLPLHICVVDRLDKDYISLLKFCELYKKEMTKDDAVKVAWDLNMIDKFKQRTMSKYHLFNIKSEDL